MPQTPALPDPRRDEDPRPASSWPDWMDDPAHLAMRSLEEDPGEGEDPAEGEDSDAPPPDVDEAELAGIGPADPDPGANTSDRCLTGTSVDPLSSTSTYRAVASQGRRLVCAASADM